MRKDYTTVLVTAFYEAVPLGPCACLKRDHPDQVYPFRAIQVKRRFGWWGPLGWFDARAKFHLVGDHAEAKLWLVPLSACVR